MSFTRRVRRLALGSALGLAAGVFASAAQAEMIGVQFYNNGAAGSGSSAGSLALAANQVAGVPSDATNSNASYLQSNWNAVGVAAPGSIASGSLAAGSLNNSAGTANLLGISMEYQSGDNGTTHKGGAYNTELTQSGGANPANPNAAGYYQTSLLDGTLAVNSNGDSSAVQFMNLPTSGYTYTVVAYTEMYGTTVERLQVGGTALLAIGGANAEGTPTVGGPGGYGTNPTTGTDQIYVTEQAGTTSGSAVTTSDTNFDFDGSTFVTSPIAFPGNSTNATTPTAASNYAVWTGVEPDSSGNLIVSWNKYGDLTSTPPTTVEGVSAVQLIATAVPEPVSASLLAVGGLGLLLRRREMKTKTVR
ncbi:MAG TPA: PEP-CTERM sorting domain-containing protein [Tepidisphaeraceae bacterium]|nr:PEP-CTERM sorting domain-containing protein [Tepidisphaeraceae bacterium]